jgi:hypothetical protein
MRRALASLVLAAISFPLMATVLFADSESALPACCRRDGKHHCVMTGAAMDSDAGGVPAIDAVRAKCPCYPTTGASSDLSNFALPGHATAIASGLLAFPAAPSQARALYRISYSRSRQKRGPPSLS